MRQPVQCVVEQGAPQVTIIEQAYKVVGDVRLGVAVFFFAGHKLSVVSDPISANSSGYESIKRA